MFLVWSNQHGMWWRPEQIGYTQIIDEAGRYSRSMAAEIVRDATLDGKLTYRRTDPVTEREYSAVSEVMVLAPESIGGAE